MAPKTRHKLFDCALNCQETDPSSDREGCFECRAALCTSVHSCTRPVAGTARACCSNANTLSRFFFFLQRLVDIPADGRVGICPDTVCYWLTVAAALVAVLCCYARHAVKQSSTRLLLRRETFKCLVCALFTPCIIQMCCHSLTNL